MIRMSERPPGVPGAALIAPNGEGCEEGAFIWVCVAEPVQPFICAVYGDATVDMLTDVETWMNQPGRIAEWGLEEDVASVLCQALYRQGETTSVQILGDCDPYGPAWEDVPVSPGYWYAMPVLPHVVEIIEP